MSWLEKLGLVERDPNYEDPEMILENLPTDTMAEEIDANTEGVSSDNLISDLYHANDLNDLSKSIFKVDELINSLPKEMATKTKRETVLAILTSFGLDAEIVTEDGENRINLLYAALKEMTDTYNNELSNCKITVEEHKKAIEDIEKQIAFVEQTSKSCNEKITAETEKIKSLIEFVKGEQ